MCSTDVPYKSIERTRQSIITDLRRATYPGCLAEHGGRGRHQRPTDREWGSAIPVIVVEDADAEPGTSSISSFDRTTEIKSTGQSPPRPLLQRQKQIEQSRAQMLPRPKPPTLANPAPQQASSPRQLRDPGEGQQQQQEGEEGEEGDVAGGAQSRYRSFWQHISQEDDRGVGSPPPVAPSSSTSTAGPVRSRSGIIERRPVTVRGFSAARLGSPPIQRSPRELVRWSSVSGPEHQKHWPGTGAAGATPQIGGPLAGSPLTGSPLTGSPLTGSPLAGSPLAARGARGIYRLTPEVRNSHPDLRYGKCMTTYTIHL